MSKPSKSDEEFERFCYAILFLFKPWRTEADVLGGFGTAIEALDDAELFESYKGLSTENVRLYKENQALRREAVAVGLRRDPGLRTHDPKVPRTVF